MSSAIEQRILQMQFDNKQFENNIATSMSSLTKFDKTLQLTGATKGLDEVNAASKRLNFNALTGAVETISSKFSAMGVIGVTALANITNSAINTGKRMIKALTVDPITTGFSEYETKINAVQTIMSNTASKGTTMAQITDTLNELNLYADKTIYNFAEMTRNIGTFTAAGVGLKESASSIQGIANLAAASGSSSQQASTAMYQLSQALAAGSVKLMDWNSVVNAGMGGQLFQEALKETAREHNIAVDSMIKEHGSFRESLKREWITTEVLNDTLKKFTVEGAKDYAEAMVKSGKYTREQAKALIKEAQSMEDAATKVKTFTQLWDTLKESAQSGWSQTWEILVGDFEEAKETLTGISQVIGGVIEDSAKSRNTLLQSWKTLGGRKTLIDALYNSLEAIGSIAKPIGEAFRAIFPRMLSTQLLKITEGIRDFTKSLILSDENAAYLKRTFKGLFSVVNLVKRAFTAIFEAIAPLFGMMGGLGGSILEVTARIGDWLYGIDKAAGRSDIFGKAVQRVVDVITVIANFVTQKAIPAIKDFFAAIKEKFHIPGLEIVHEALGRAHERMTQIGDAAGSMKLGVSNAFTAMGRALANSGFVKFLVAIWEAVKIVGGGIGKAFGDFFGGLADKIADVNFDSVIDFINALSLGGLALAANNFDIFGSFKEAASGFTDKFGKIGAVLDSVKDSLEAWQTQLKSGVLLKIAAAIGILAASLLTISLIDSDKLGHAIGSITVMFTELVGALAIMDNMSGGGKNQKGILGLGTNLILVSTALLIMAGAMKKISELNFQQLSVGIVGLTSVVSVMVGAAKALSTDGKKTIKGATQMVIFAAAIKILASACEDLSTLNWNQLSKGLVGVGVLLGEVSLFLSFSKFQKGSVGAATGIVILSAAIKILASACEDFASMNVEQLIKGLGSISLILGELTLFTRFSGSGKGMISTGLGIIAVAGAMKIFASAVKDFSSMSPDQLIVGLTGMATSLLAVTLAMNSLPSDMVAKSLGMLAVAAALVVIADAVETMGGMTWDEIGRGMTVLAGSLILLTGALYLMQGTLAGSAALLIAAGALAVMAPTLSLLGAMSWEAIGKGLVALAGAFAVVGIAGLLLAPILPAILGLGTAMLLIGAGAAAVGVGIALAGIGIAALATGIASLATVTAAGATAIVAAITIIVTGLLGLIPAVAKTIGEAIVVICVVIADSATELAKAATTIVIAILDAITVLIPKIIDTVHKILKALLEFIVAYVPELVDAGMRLMVGLMNGIADNIDDIIEAGTNIVISFIDGITRSIPKLVEAGYDMIIEMLQTLTKTIEENHQQMTDAGWDLAEAIIKGMVDGIVGGVKRIADAAKGLAEKALDGVRDFLDINSPSKKFIKIGESTGEGFVMGILKGTRDVEHASQDMGAASVDAILTEADEAAYSKGVTLAQKYAQGVRDGAREVAASLDVILTEADNALYENGKSVSQRMKDRFGGESDEVAETANEVVEANNAISSSMRGTAKTAEDIAKESFDKFKTDLENRKYFNQITLQEELEAWEGAQVEYQNYADIRIEAEKEVYRVKKELAEAEYQSYIDWIEQRKAANELSLIDELAAYKRMQQVYIEGSEERLKVDKEVLRVQNEINEANADYYNSLKDIEEDAAARRLELQEEYADREKQIYDQLERDIQSLEDSYESALKSRTDKLYQAYSLFDRADPVEAADGSTLTSNLQSQIEALEYYNTAINGLAGRNVDSALLDELREMGPSSSAQIAALNAMSDEELTAYVELWRKKHQLAKEQATFEMQGLRTQTNTQIEALREEADAELDEYNSMWNEKLAELNADTEKKLEELKTDWMKKIGTLTDQTENEFSQMTANIINIVGEKSQWQESGANIIEGMLEGVVKEKTRLLNKLQEVMDEALAVANGELDINSPSGEFMKIGRWSILGLVKGLEDNSAYALQATAKVGKNTVNALRDTISNIISYVEDGVNTQPTITPVLDLTDLESDAHRLNSIFSRSQAVAISAGLSRRASSEIQNGDSQTAANPSITFTQNNYSPKALSRTEIYRQTKNQISTMKGLVKK